MLVLGAAGFLGGEIAVRLADAGHRVTCFLRPERIVRDAFPSRLRGAGCTVAGVDLSRFHGVRAAFRRLEPEAVIDAAWTGVAAGERDRRALQRTNVRRTETLLEACDRGNTRIWVGLGSQAEYGRFEGRVGEDAPCAPETEYGKTKEEIRQLLAEAISGPGARLAWLRLFGVYGPHQPSGWLVPDAIKALLRNDPFDVAAGEQRFDYLYVADMAEACLGILECEEASGIFNVGSGKAVSIRSIVTELRRLSGSHSELRFGARRPAEHGRFVEADIEKLQLVTGWSPRTALVSGLVTTLDWQREVLGVHA